MIVSQKNVELVPISMMKNVRLVSMSVPIRAIACGYCPETFASLQELTKHRIVHANQIPFWCHLCIATFQLAKDLLKHKRIAHPTVYPCGLCDKPCKTTHKLRLHMKNVHLITTRADDQPFECNKCTENFKLIEDLKQHKKIAHPIEYPFPCDQCEKSFRASRLLECHKKRDHDGNLTPFICTDCGVSFKYRYSLNEHIKNKHMGIVHKCPLCDKTITKGNMKSHMKIHNCENVKCEHCGNICANERALLRHIKMKHEGRTYKTYKTTLICHVCGKTVGKDYLKTHMDTHNGIKEHTCDVCGKKFRSKTQLKTHQVVHTNEKPFKCDVCNTCFTQKSSLSIHKRKHNDDRRYECNLCDKAFFTKTLLTYHKRKHENL